MKIELAKVNFYKKIYLESAFFKILFIFLLLTNYKILECFFPSVKSFKKLYFEKLFEAHR